MSEITDKQRLDFLQKGRWTRWVGYDTPNGNCVWPVFAGGDLRSEIDKAIHHYERSQQKYEEQNRAS